MTIDNVQDITPRRQYVATAGQTVFAYPFPIFADADLVVVNNNTTKILTTDYTVSGSGTNTGGNVTLLVGCTVGDIVTIYRNIAIARSTNFQQNGPLNSATFNTELDRVVLMVQQVEEAINRALRIPTTANVIDSDISLDPSTWANKYLTFDVNGKPTPAALLSATVTQAIITGLVNPRTPEEITLGIIPTNTRYLDGNVLRYGTNTVPGTTDMTTAIQNCLNVCGLSGKKCRVPAGVYKVSADLTVPVGVSFLNAGPPFAVDIEGEGREQTILLFTAGTNGVYFNGVSGYKLTGKISDITLDGTTVMPTVLTFANCDMPRAERVLVRRCTGRGVFFNTTIMGRFDNCYVVSCGSAGQAQLELLNSTTFEWHQSYCSTGNAAAVAAVRVDKSANTNFFGGAVESPGTIQIGALADTTQGCVGGVLFGVDFEKPTDHFLEFGYGMSSTALVQGWQVRGNSGYPSGAASVPYAVKLNACTSIRFGDNNWAQNGSPVATYWLEGVTNSGVVIEAHPELYGQAWPWVKQNGAQILSATPLVDFTQKDVIAMNVVPNVVTLTGATPTLTVQASQGGTYARGRFFNGGAITVTSLGGGVGTAGGAGLGQLFIGQSTNGNTTLTHAPATPGAFNLPGGQNFLMQANTWYLFVGDGTAWCLVSPVTGLTQITGWGTPTGAVVQNNYAGATATLPQTSAAVAEIITVLKNLGLFGA